MVYNDKLSACEFVLFGTKGDLARRKLLPSLYLLDKAGLIHEDTRIIGVARENVTKEEYVNVVVESLERFIGDELIDEVLERFIQRLTMHV